MLADVLNLSVPNAVPGRVKHHYARNANWLPGLRQHGVPLSPASSMTGIASPSAGNRGFTWIG